MSRCLLHKDKLEEFKAWLTEHRIEHRPGRGEYQVLQIKRRDYWACIYERNHAPEHLTTDRRLDGLVMSFVFKDRKFVNANAKVDPDAVSPVWVKVDMSAFIPPTEGCDG